MAIATDGLIRDFSSRIEVIVILKLISIVVIPLGIGFIIWKFINSLDTKIVFDVLFSGTMWGFAGFLITAILSAIFDANLGPLLGMFFVGPICFIAGTLFRYRQLKSKPKS